MSTNITNFFCGLLLFTCAISNECAAEQPTPMKPENAYEEHTVSVQEDGKDVSFRYRLATRPLANWLFSVKMLAPCIGDGEDSRCGAS